MLFGAPFVVATESFTSRNVPATLKLTRTLSMFFTVQSFSSSVATQWNEVRKSRNHPDGHCFRPPTSHVCFSRLPCPRAAHLPPTCHPKPQSLPRYASNHTSSHRAAFFSGYKPAEKSYLQSFVALCTHYQCICHKSLLFNGCYFFTFQFSIVKSLRSSFLTMQRYLLHPTLLPLLTPLRILAHHKESYRGLWHLMTQ